MYLGRREFTIPYLVYRADTVSHKHLPIWRRYGASLAAMTSLTKAPSGADARSASSSKEMTIHERGSLLAEVTIM